MIDPAEVSYEWIDTNTALTEFVSFACQQPAYYLDTEFHREKTYFPQLALVQIATGDRLAIIDPVAVDMSQMRSLFDGPTMCVLHAAQQDLDVMYQSCGFIPARIIDTQLLACFLGHSQPSLASLLQSFIKITVPKGDRLTDWLRRPLSKDQLQYAASDVAYLEEMSQLILHELEKRGRTQWALDACEELRLRPTGPNAPEDAWLRVKDVRTLKGRARWIARSVAQWREERAMELDLPPRHILSDIAILGIAQRAPKTAEDLLQSRGVDNRHVTGAQGKALLEAITLGVQDANGGDLRFPASDTDDLEKSLRPAITLVSAWITELARQSQLDASLLGTRKDIVDLLSGSSEAKMGQGWRAEIVGRDVEDLVAGRKALTFTSSGPLSGLKLVEVEVS